MEGGMGGNGGKAAEYSFGRYRFAGEERVLYRDGEPVPLMPKAVDTLVALLERRGQVVDKAELMRLVWPDCTVEEIGLARNISLLRKTLGEEGDAFIETVPKRGYRFRAAEAGTGVEAEVEAAAPRRGMKAMAVAGGLAAVALAVGLVAWQFYWPSRFVPSLGGRALVAVMTVECLSPELEQAAFGRGLSEALAAEMEKTGAVQVISPGTVRRYEKWRIPGALMARVLGVDALMEGTGQVFGDRIRVGLRLSDVHSGRLLWGESYERAAGDAGAVEVEAEVARRAAEQAAGRLRQGH